MQDYKDLQEIGRGSFAIVYKALYKLNTKSNNQASGADLGNVAPAPTTVPNPSNPNDSNNYVAIKVITKSKLNSKLKQNLDLEIKILAAAKHQNIVELFKVYTTQTEINLIMEYCALGDLSIFIKKKGNVPGMASILSNNTLALAGPWGGLEQVAIRCFAKQLACAIEFLRFNSIIHRDLKPQNILLTQVGNSSNASIGSDSYLPLLKLCDFGFARSLSSTGLASTLCGSPLYMAPEILKGASYDSKSDLWSIGAILYEMVVGKPPFRAQNHIELLRKIEGGDGWIQFPDEKGHGSSAGLSHRDFRVGSILNRKTVSSTTLTQRALGAASLGSSPSDGGHFYNNRHNMPFIPDDIKGLIRRLLKRNPVERMGFEEFFLASGLKLGNIGEMRKDALNSSSLKTSRTSNISSCSHYTCNSQIEDTEILDKTEQDQDSQLLPPFPSYTHDPNWSNQILHTDSVTFLSNRVTTPMVATKIVLREPQPLVSENDINASKTESGSLFSFGSLSASLKFSSDEEESTTQNLTSQPKQQKREIPVHHRNGHKNDEEEFVVVERGPAAILIQRSPKINEMDDSPRTTRSAPAQVDMTNWSPRASPVVHSSSLGSGNSQMQPPVSLTDKDSQNAYANEAKQLVIPKGRLFGSLRSDSSNIMKPIDHNSSTEISDSVFFFELINVLPFVSESLSSDILQGNDRRKSIIDIFLYTARAFAVCAKSNELIEILPTVQVFELLVYGVELYQSAIDLCKKEWNNLMENSRFGLPMNSVAQELLAALIRFIQNQFDFNLEKAQELQQSGVLMQDSKDSKFMPQIIFEIAVASCKRGASLGSGTKSGIWNYKVALLLCQIIIPDSRNPKIETGGLWESLDVDEITIIRGLMSRIERVVKSRPKIRN